MKRLPRPILVCLCLLAGLTRVHAAPDDPSQSWSAAWDADHTDFKRSIIGDLAVADGRLRFTPVNGRQGFIVELADLKRVAESTGYGRTAHAVVIERRSGDRYYVALLDRSMLFASPRKFLDALDKLLPRRN
jgi:hypothetical protein